MKAISYLLLLGSLIMQSAASGEKSPDSTDMTITILYDNASKTDSVIADHGFSCLIESGGHSCLFDAGRISKHLMANVNRLGVDCSRINDVVISHFHDDHMGGLSDILAKCHKPKLYLPFSYPHYSNEPLGDRADADFVALLDSLKQPVSEIIRKKEPVKIADGFYTTGMIEDQTYEQALIVQTSKGPIVITGCAHPGILEIVRRARELMKQDILCVMGGFHLTPYDSAQILSIAQDLQKLTKYIGPCHCTGEKAEGIFRNVFGDDYIAIHAGLKLRWSKGELKY